jgi:hypothetical protein
MDVFATDEAKLSSARLVRNVGELLTAMEVSAANRFWHVWGSTNSTNLSDGEQETSHVNSYPPEYTKPVVGMLYETMANFQVSLNLDLIAPIAGYADKFSQSIVTDLVRSRRCGIIRYPTDSIDIGSRTQR